MPLFINFLDTHPNLNPNIANSLRQFLFEQLQNGVRHWDKETVYPFSPPTSIMGKTTFTLSHTIRHRPRREPERPGQYLEIIENTGKVSADTSCAEPQVLGTLVLPETVTLNIFIDVLGINQHPHTALYLKQFLHQQIQAGSSYWEADTGYPLMNAVLGETTVTLSNSILLRPRKSMQKLGQRLEILENTVHPNLGAQGSVYRSLGTLVLTSDTLIVSRIKQRVVKFFHSHISPYNEGQIAEQLPHLHAKPLARYKRGTDQQRFALVMRRLGEITLAAYLTQEQLSLQARLTLTLKVIQAYIDQIEVRGVVHRDIKPTNIVIDANEPFQVNFIDVATAISLTPAVTTTTRFFSPAEAASPLAVDETGLFPVFMVTEKFSRCVAQQELQEQADTAFIGTFGYVPPEAFDKEPSVTKEYDRFAMASVLADIWGYHRHAQAVNAYQAAAREARTMSYMDKLSKTLLPSDEARHQIERLLTALSAPQPQLRPSMQEAYAVFERLTSLMIGTQFQENALQQVSQPSARNCR